MYRDDFANESTHAVFEGARPTFQTINDSSSTRRVILDRPLLTANRDNDNDGIRLSTYVRFDGCRRVSAYFFLDVMCRHVSCICHACKPA